MPVLMYALLSFAAVQWAGSGKSQAWKGGSSSRWRAGEWGAVARQTSLPELRRRGGQAVKEGERARVGVAEDEEENGEFERSAESPRRGGVGGGRGRGVEGGYGARGRWLAGSGRGSEWREIGGIQERRRGAPYRANGRSKDVWINPHSSTDAAGEGGEGAGEEEEEEMEVTEGQKGEPGDKELKSALQKHLWMGYGPESERYSWPERRDAMVEVQTAENVGDALLRVGEKLEITDLNALLRRFGRLGRWQESSVLFEWMKRHDKLSAPTYTSFLSVLGKAGEVERALQVFLDLRDRDIRSNLYVWNSMLSTLVCNGKVEKGFHFFQLMKEEGLEPDRITYSTMIAGCSKALGGFYKAQELVKEMREKDIRLDSVMYGALINVCASNHMVEEARATFDEMQAEGFIPNLFHFSSLLNSYALKGRYEEAEQVLLEIKAAGLKPNKVVYNSLINAYARAKLPQKARGIFDEMSAYGLQPDMISFCSLMDAYAKVGQVEEAQELFDQMKASGLKPASNSYSILISAYGKSGKLSMIKKLSEEMDSIIGGDLDIHLYNSLLKVYCNAGVMDGVMDILRKMDTQACSPNRITFHILMAYFCKEDLCDLALRTFEDMEARGYHANETSYTILIQGFLKYNKVDDALGLLGEMHKQGVSPNKVIYQELISGCLTSKKLLEAQQVFELMKASPHMISQSVIEAYLEVFAGEGKMEVVKDALQVMNIVGYRPRQETWDDLLSKLIEQERYDFLLKFVEEPNVHVSPKTKSELVDRVRALGHTDLLKKFKESFESMEQVSTKTSRSS